MQVKYRIDDMDAIYETGVEQVMNPNESVHAKISVTIGGELYVAESWSGTESAVIDLQNKLPRNVRIICCQSCIHGNFCLFGDFDDEIFCLSDLEPKTKGDLIDVMQDDAQREKRSRNLLYACDGYREITDDKYSYNDWKYWIHR